MILDQINNMCSVFMMYIFFIGRNSKYNTYKKLYRSLVVEINEY